MSVLVPVAAGNSATWWCSPPPPALHNGSSRGNNSLPFQGDVTAQHVPVPKGTSFWFKKHRKLINGKSSIPSDAIMDIPRETQLLQFWLQVWCLKCLMLQSAACFLFALDSYEGRLSPTGGMQHLVGSSRPCTWPISLSPPVFNIPNFPTYHHDDGSIKNMLKLITTLPLHIKQNKMYSFFSCI